MTKEEALQEAKRCFNCPQPRCANGCPVLTLIAQFIQELKEGNVDAAAAILNKNNFMSAITCRVCDQKHQCEGSCIQGIRGKSIAIGQLECFANDNGCFTPTKKASNGRKVAVIGSGPSGLTFANALSLEGFAVTVFEKEKMLGGMVRYGIPDFRLDKKILDNLIERLYEQDVKFVTNREIKDNGEVQKLLQEFDYIYIATGSGVSKFMGIPGEDLHGDVFGATEFLAILNGQDNALKKQLQKDFCGKQVIVVGGGNVAMDGARCARHLGAEVTVVYRRSKSEMPARQDEYEDALQEGISFDFLTNPCEIKMDKGRVKGLRCNKMQLGEPDESGRASVMVQPNSDYVLSCDKVIFAVGQKPGWQSGKLKIDSRGLTDMDRVYAGGDLVTGPATVVKAVAAANRAAQSIIGIRP
ncbi:MAG: FAD-dependent oxidoreductase [Acidaminococcaceae bacterium]|nr:FAD-dependent oxidoreductase [Acidaminococcaceae bacterium]